MVTFNRDVKRSFRQKHALEFERIESGQAFLAGGKALDLGKAAFFDVAARHAVDLAAGDKILLRANDKKAGWSTATCSPSNTLPPMGLLRVK